MVPPTSNLKTYCRRTNSSIDRSRSVDVFNALFAQNLHKRKQKQKPKKSKLQIKELPSPDRHHDLMKDSFEVPKNFDDPFDKVVNLPTYNKVNIVRPSTGQEESVCPTNEVSDSSILRGVLRTSRKNVKECFFDPCLKQMSKTTNLLQETNHSLAPKVNKSNFNQKTLDKSVSESLLLEKVRENSKYKNISTLGSLSDISNSKSNVSKLVELRQDKFQTPYECMFKDCNTLLAASTPVARRNTPVKSRPTIEDPMSPICQNSELLVDSYKEIKSWSTKLPDFNTTPVINRASNKIKKNRFTDSKIKINNLQTRVTTICSDTPEFDWKLKVQPKVVLEDYLNILGISNSVTFEKSYMFHGFKASSVKKSKTRNDLLRGILKRQSSSVRYSLLKTRIASANTPIKIKKRRVPKKISNEPKMPITKHLRVVLENCSLHNEIKSKQEVSKKSDGQEILTRREDLAKEKSDLCANEERILNEKECRNNVDTMLFNNFICSVEDSFKNSSEFVKRETFNNCTLRNPMSNVCDKRNTSLLNLDTNYTGTFNDFESSDDEIESIGHLIASISDDEFDEKPDATFNSELSISLCSPVDNEDLNGRDKETFDNNFLVISKVIGNAKSDEESDEDIFDSSDIYASYLEMNFVNQERRNSKSLVDNSEFVINSTRDYLTVDNDTSLINLVDKTANNVPRNFNNSSVILLNSSEDEQEQCNEITSSTMITSPKLQDDSSSFNSMLINRNSSFEQCSNSENADVIEVYSSDDELLDSITNNTEVEATALPPVNLTTSETDLSLSNLLESNNIFIPNNARLTLRPGKSWRRSLSCKRTSVMVKTNIISGLSSCRRANRSRISTQIVPESPLHKIRECTNISILESYASTFIDQEKTGISDFINEPKQTVTAKDIVLRRCGQIKPLPFVECYPPSILQNCFKIGEGVYGEVFLFRNADSTVSVMKVIPIEGHKIVNGERQKKFEEILSEIVIAGELSNLRNGACNQTNTFSEVKRIRCVRGLYPSRLLELWQLYEENHGSENDSPEIFNDDQLYIVLELANGGNDMESYIFNNSTQALSIFKQTACALAVAEVALQFEHRDLHWGNILVSQTEKQQVFSYCIDGVDIDVISCGVKATIIDFTLSRITFEGVCIYNNLGADPELFEAHGDYQFEVYRLMQKHNQNDWQHFDPYTNILWLHYILDKMVHMLRYKYKKTKIHEEGARKLLQMKDRILNFSSVADFIKEEFC